MPDPNQAPNQPDMQAEREQAFASINELVENGKALDGPTLNEVNLSYENRVKLGYDGSIDRFVSDASDWKTQKEEEQRIADYHEANAQKAADWRKDKDALRETREAANARIDSLVDGTAATEGLSYKEKLEKGGEYGLNFLVKTSKMDKEAAIAQTAEEGHDISHTQPRHYDVVTDKAAEARAAEMVEFLNAARATTATADVVRTSVMTDEQRAKFFANSNKVLEEQAALTPERSGRLQRIREKLSAWRSEKAGEGTILGSLVERFNDTFETKEGGRLERSREGVKQIFNALGGLKNRAQEKLLVQKMAIGDALRPNPLATKEELTNRNRKLALVGAGVGVLAVYALSHLGVESHSTVTAVSDAGVTPKAPSGDFIKHALEFVKDQPAHKTGAGTEHIAQHVTLTSGENPWEEAKSALHAHASNAEIDEVKNAALKLNHVTEAQATHLAVGQHWENPVELINKLNEEAKKTS